MFLPTEELDVQNILKPESIPEYLRMRDVIWQNLISINTNLFTLSRIDEFPFRLLFPEYGDRIFWQTTRRVLVEATLVNIRKLVLDPDDRSFTIDHFRKYVSQNALEPAKSALDNTIKQSDFDDRLSQVRNRINYIRNKYVAHLDKEAVLDSEDSPHSTVTFADLHGTLIAATELFDVLCFGHHHNLWLWDYSERARQDRTTDIDALLLNYASTSRVLDFPEREPENVPLYFKGFNEAEIMIINSYRERLGLPAISVVAAL
ncbi:MAG: hypothetical protein JNM70_01905 [Anaerolineae bacterium]|nr:hypothetical protein [Anaerolineae bacterium]